ncbi:MAG: YncE family protein [bacterium]
MKKFCNQKNINKLSSRGYYVAMTISATFMRLLRHFIPRNARNDRRTFLQISIISGFIFVFAFVLPTFGTELPKPILNYIKTDFPKVNVRFDGLIELPDGTAYLPVFPLSYADVENPTEIITTIPENSNFSSKPNLILFANNFSLLKIIKMPGQSPTLLSSNKIPLKVKLGLLPQDLIVPENLVIPPELRIILGDLKIPIKGEENQEKIIGKINIFENQDNPKTPDSITAITQPIIPTIDPQLNDLYNKTFYITNLKSKQIYIVYPFIGRPSKTIELSSIPSDMIMTDDGRYLLATGLSSNKVSVIDTLNNSLARELNVGSLPISIVISKDMERAYIANKSSSSISVVDLKNMEIIQTVNIIGFPSNLALSEDSKNLFYSDAATGKIFRVSAIDKREVDLVTQANNVSKISLFNNYLFILSRTDNALIVYDLKKDKLIKTIKVGNKPVDIKISKNKNKLYVLSAGSDSLNIMDISTLEISKTIALKSNGFPKNINIIDSTNKALISSVNSYEIVIVNLDQEEITGYLPISVTIGSLVVSTK